MTLLERYEIYVAQATELGWDILTFDEWLER